MKIICAELTAFSSEDPAGYKDFPKYLNDVWPLIWANREALTGVYEITDDESLRIWGDLSNLSSEEIEYIKYRGYYSGHLNIIYKTNSQETIMRLIGLWPYKSIVRYSSDILKMSEKQKEAIDQLVDKLSPAEFLFGFAHDADPMYVISLKQLEDSKD